MCLVLPSRNYSRKDCLSSRSSGFISHTEVETLRNMRILASRSGSNSDEVQQLSVYLGNLRRRITDYSRGGYYQFYGYKEFANRVFRVTKKVNRKTSMLHSLYTRMKTNFHVDIQIAVQKGYVVIDNKNH